MAILICNLKLLCFAALVIVVNKCCKDLRNKLLRTSISIFFSGQKTTMILYRQSGILYIFWHWWRTLSFTTSVEPTTDISRNKLRSGLSTMGGNHLLLLGYKKNPNDVIWPLNLQTSEHLMSDIYTTKSWWISNTN